MNVRQRAPLYLEIKNQILNEINHNNFKPGQKMPTERELARRLNTSRNTVSHAYDMLIKEGVLVAQQGKGTFVNCVDKPKRQKMMMQAFVDRVDDLLDDVLSEGITTESFLSVVEERVRRKEEMMQNVNAVFVECNIEQARIFAREITEMTHLGTIPIVLSALRQYDEKVQKTIAAADFVFTTFSHLTEVRELTANENSNVYGVAVRPCLEGIVKIAQFPGETNFCLISTSEEFYSKFNRNMQSAGLAGLSISHTNTRVTEELEATIGNADVIIVSPGRYEEVKKLVAGRKEVIIFNTTLDPGSAKALLPLFRDGGGEDKKN
ncbi:winged helix-turn-helix domain-containing protein [Dethiobacter alkaliphilus]|uniref:winged helix-turn-helix domain-containing protein n=1 Tax=Dethiobacter alkaliphilus TaxID=427926 RepID=UPI0022271C5C|nr:winged helix-turn-helix domain-containing protein [Dethiobacter alkaliphilus]MCW3489685.1 winged helix-turn-helix domain-containing protein [Dethiobacter alkaliphilus]